MQTPRTLKKQVERQTEIILLFFYIFKIKLVSWGNLSTARFFCSVHIKLSNTSLSVLISVWDGSGSSDLCTLDHGSGFRTLLFSSMPSKMQTKHKFSLASFLFCLLLSVGTLTSVFRDSKPLASHKRDVIKVFQKFLLVNGRIRILEAHKLTDPADPERYL
jgi:hypothetical protein